MAAAGLGRRAGGGRRRRQQPLAGPRRTGGKALLTLRRPSSSSTCTTGASASSSAAIDCARGLPLPAGWSIDLQTVGAMEGRTDAHRRAWVNAAASWAGHGVCGARPVWRHLPTLRLQLTTHRKRRKAACTSARAPKLWPASNLRPERPLASLNGFERCRFVIRKLRRGSRHPQPMAQSVRFEGTAAGGTEPIQRTASGQGYGSGLRRCAQRSVARAAVAAGWRRPRRLRRLRAAGRELASHNPVWILTLLHPQPEEQVLQPRRPVHVRRGAGGARARVLSPSTPARSPATRLQASDAPTLAPKRPPRLAPDHPKPLHPQLHHGDSKGSAFTREVDELVLSTERQAGAAAQASLL